MTLEKECTDTKCTHGDRVRIPVAQDSRILRDLDGNGAYWTVHRHTLLRHGVDEQFLNGPLMQRYLDKHDQPGSWSRKREAYAVPPTGVILVDERYVVGVLDATSIRAGIVESLQG